MKALYQSHWTVSVVALISLAGPASAQAVDAPQPTPQQAIDFAKQYVEQFSVVSCPASTRGDQTDVDERSLIEVNGPSLIIQAKWKSALNDGRAPAVMERVTVTTIPMNLINEITVGSGLKECRDTVQVVFIRFSCKNEIKCITWGSTFRDQDADPRRPIDRSTSQSQTQSGADLKINDVAVAQRVAKALNFYRSTVASAPSPF